VSTQEGGVIASVASPTLPVKQSGLAFTGANIGEMFATALALIGMGGFLILLSRHRRRHEAQLS